MLICIWFDSVGIMNPEVVNVYILKNDVGSCWWLMLICIWFDSVGIMNPEVVNVYILKNDVGSFYCGITNNLARRIEEHRAGMSVYTSRFSGWYLVWNEEFENRKVARMLEVQIKNFGVGRWYRKHKPASSPVGSLAWGRDGWHGNFGTGQRTGHGTGHRTGHRHKNFLTPPVFISVGKLWQIFSRHKMATKKIWRNFLSVGKNRTGQKFLWLCPPVPACARLCPPVPACDKQNKRQKNGHKFFWDGCACCLPPQTNARPTARLRPPDCPTAPARLPDRSGTVFWQISDC